MLGNFTDQGIRNIKDSPKRAAAFKAVAKKSGATVRGLYWTLGRYDIALLVEAPDDETMTSLALGVGSLGNVRTHIMRAFTEDEIAPIINKAVKKK
jgi:uncharacterized protein with GYD domain